MAWALWLDEEHRSAKMFLEFNVLKGTPQRARLSEGNASEGAALRADLRAGQLYRLDAGYSEYRLLQDIRPAHSSFVARLHDNAVYDLLEERPLTEADRAAGVTFDRVVWLGSKAKRDALSQPVRLVQVHVRSVTANGLARRRVSSQLSSPSTTLRMRLPHRLHRRTCPPTIFAKKRLHTVRWGPCPINRNRWGAGMKKNGS
jgi:hypothetical protein